MVMYLRRFFLISVAAGWGSKLDRCLREYLGLRKMKWRGGGENCLMISRVCANYRILLGWLNKGGGLAGCVARMAEIWNGNRPLLGLGTGGGGVNKMDLKEIVSIKAGMVLALRLSRNVVLPGASLLHIPTFIEQYADCHLVTVIGTKKRL
jgi:hypothetical protein